VPPIIDRATFEAVQRQLALNRLRSPRRNRAPETWLLRGGFAVCGVCGHRMYAASTNGKPAYRCDWSGHPRGALRPTIAAAELDRLVWQAVHAVMERDDVLQHGLELVMSEQPAERELAGIERVLNQLKRQQGNLAKAIAMASDDTALAPLMAEMERVAQRLRELEAERAALARQAEVWARMRDQYQELARWRRQVAQRLDAMDYRERRWLLDLLGLVARVYPEDDPEHDRVEITLGLPLGVDIDLTTTCGWGAALLARSNGPAVRRSNARRWRRGRSPSARLSSPALGGSPTAASSTPLPWATAAAS
jgi:hypothetical protein